MSANPSPAQTTVGSPTNILLSGVGGQGVVLASHLLGLVAMAQGYDVKQSEVHGMSQRGGSVTSHLRFGTRVWSPLIVPGTVDVLLAFEPLEALRYLHWLRPCGLVVYNSVRVNPSPVAAGMAEYPANVDQLIVSAHPRARSIDANAIAEDAGSAKAVNVVLLGAASAELPFAKEAWETIIEQVVPPKTVAVNLRAFAAGANA